MGFFSKKITINYKRNFKKQVHKNTILHEPVSAILAGITALWKSITFYATAYTLFGIKIATLIKSTIIFGSMAYSYYSIAKGRAGRESMGIHRGGHLLNTMSSTEPIKIGYGEARIGGNNVFIHTTDSPQGGKNKILHLVLALCEGEVEGISTDGTGDKIWLDDKRVQYYETFKGKDLVDYYFHSGSNTQTVDLNLQSVFSSWKEPMRNTAYIYFKVTYHYDAFTSLPEFTVQLKMKKIYDPRNGQVAYSRNPALVAFDFLTNKIYGMGIDISYWDLDSVKDAANWCDTNGLYFDGVIVDRKSAQDNIEDILNCFRGYVVESMGKYYLRTYKDETPVMSLGEDDLVMDVCSGRALGFLETPKLIKFSYIDANDNYLVKHGQYPEGAIETTSNDRVIEIPFIGISSYERALKMAKYHLLRSQFNREFSFQAKLKAWALEPGDIITITKSFLGWNNKKVRVKEVGIPQRGWVPLTVIEEDPAIYDSTVNITTHQSYKTTIPSPDDSPPMPTGLSASTGPDEETENKIDAYIDFQWDNMGYGLDYEIQFRKSDDTTWQKHFVKKIKGYCETPVGYGSGWFKLINNGEFYGPSNKNYLIRITTVGSPSKFGWSDDGGNSYKGWDIPITGNWQDLNYGVKIKFNQTSGGYIMDFWEFEAKYEDPIKVRIGRLECNKIYYWRVRSIDDKIESEWATPSQWITTWSPSAPSMAGYSPVLTPLKYGKQIKVDWSSWSGFGEPNVKDYEIYCSTTKPCPIEEQYRVASGIKGSNYTIKNLIPGQIYDIRVRPMGWGVAGTPSD
ncbi:MAG: phage tail protein [candidate division WOR-3 bacterium]